MQKYILLHGQLKSLHHLPIGINFFIQTLIKIDHNEQEIFVVYVTINQNPTPIPDMEGYTQDNFQACNDDFAKNIKMIMTVTSSKGAFITHHMGISESTESILIGARPKGISIDLHSLGAKIMLMRNPERIYMITNSTATMRKIILKALPAGSVFRETLVGQLSVQHVLERRLCRDRNRDNLSLEVFGIHNKDERLLAIDVYNETYGWLFKTDTGMPWIAVDLHALANAR